LAYLPLASRHLAAFTTALVGHLTNFPFASRHGAPTEGAEAETIANADKAKRNLRI
jgi:hypothetical protein